MIYYGSNHIQAARALEEKYDLPHKEPKEYINEQKLFTYIKTYDRDRLFYAIQKHPTLHAYTLADLKLYVHPTTLVKLLSATYREFFENIV